MTVYVVIHHDIESGEVLGLFSSRDKAESAIRDNGAECNTEDRWRAVSWYYADIEEFELL